MAKGYFANNGTGGGGADIFTQIRNGTLTDITSSHDLSICTQTKNSYQFSYILTIDEWENDYFGNSIYCAYAFYYSTLRTFIGDISGTQTSCCLAMFYNSDLEYFESDMSGLTATHAGACSNFFYGTSLTEAVIKGQSDVPCWGYSTNICVFGRATGLTDLSWQCDIVANMNLSFNTSLNFDSVLDTLNNLFDYSAGSAHTITFNITIADVGGQLAAAVATATSRNWTVTGLTIT